MRLKWTPHSGVPSTQGQVLSLRENSSGRSSKSSSMRLLPAFQTLLMFQSYPDVLVVCLNTIGISWSEGQGTGNSESFFSNLDFGIFNQWNCLREREVIKDSERWVSLPLSSKPGIKMVILGGDFRSSFWEELIPWLIWCLEWNDMCKAFGTVAGTQLALDEWQIPT